MIDGYISIARKLSKEFDIVLAKELFSSFVARGMEVHLIVSLGGDDIKYIPKNQSKFFSFDKQITHLFKLNQMKLNLYFE